MIVDELFELDPQGIQNIIFDWGGVIINIDFQASIMAFNEITDSKFEAFFNHARSKPLFDDLETGTISANQFYSGLQNEFGNYLTTKSINEAWCEMLHDIPQKRVEILKQLGQGYRVFLLSNTNIIHENIIVDRLNKELGFKFFSLFEKVYLSHRIGMRKPNKDIFDFVLKDSKLDPAKTVFIDDTLMHIKTADSRGICAYHLKENRDISKLFKTWL